MVFLTPDSEIRELVLLVALTKLSKTPQGIKVIEVLGREFIKGMFDMLHGGAQASAANKVTSWAYPYLQALVLERFGFINPYKMLEFSVGISVITGAGIAEGFVDSLQGLFPFTKPEPSEYPSNIVYSARTNGGEVKATLGGEAALDTLKQLRQELTTTEQT